MSWFLLVPGIQFLMGFLCLLNFHGMGSGKPEKSQL